MKDAGVEVERYHEPHWSHLPRLNNRTHRKMLVVDGKVGFTGGVGIADKWRGDAQDAEHWRDTHFRVRGPVVAQMQAVFMDNWIKATGRVLHGERLLPGAASRAASMPAQMFSSSPSGGSESMHLMYLLAITAADDEHRSVERYFVPDELTVERAGRGGAARRQGAHHRARAEHRLRRRARAPRAPLGAAARGRRPDRRVPADDVPLQGAGRRRLLVSVGSTNFDNRSFRLNDEANLNLLDEKFAAEQVRVFEHDLSRSKVVTLAAWRDPAMEGACHSSSSGSC